MFMLRNFYIEPKICLSVVTQALIPYVMYPSNPKVVMQEKPRFILRCYLQNESIPLVTDFKSHVSETCESEMSNYTYCKNTPLIIRIHSPL